jgi:hypothetical protein
VKIHSWKTPVKEKRSLSFFYMTTHLRAGVIKCDAKQLSTDHGDRVLLLFKYWDVEQQTLRWLGSGLFYRKSSPLKVLQSIWLKMERDGYCESRPPNPVELPYNYDMHQKDFRARNAVDLLGWIEYNREPFKGKSESLEMDGLWNGSIIVVQRKFTAKQQDDILLKLYKRGIFHREIHMMAPDYLKSLDKGWMPQSAPSRQQQHQPQMVVLDAAGGGKPSSERSFVFSFQGDHDASDRKSVLPLASLLDNALHDEINKGLTWHERHTSPFANAPSVSPKPQYSEDGISVNGELDRSSRADAKASTPNQTPTIVIDNAHSPFNGQFEFVERSDDGGGGDTPHNNPLHASPNFVNPFNLPSQSSSSSSALDLDWQFALSLAPKFDEPAEHDHQQQQQPPQQKPFKLELEPASVADEDKKKREAQSHKFENRMQRLIREKSLIATELAQVRSANHALGETIRGLEATLREVTDASVQKTAESLLSAKLKEKSNECDLLMKELELAKKRSQGQAIDLKNKTSALDTLHGKNVRLQQTVHDRDKALAEAKRKSCDSLGQLTDEELEALVARVKQETKARREKKENECGVCMERPKDHVLVPCGHQVVCGECIKKIDSCPICRQAIVSSVKVFKA